MSTRYKYTITTKKGINVSTIDTDMQRATSKAQYPFFPTRSVTVVDQRPLNNRSTDYYLTYSESLELLKDPDILSVQPVIIASTGSGEFMPLEEGQGNYPYASQSSYSPGLAITSTGSIGVIGNYVAGRGYSNTSVDTLVPNWPAPATASMNINLIMDSLKNADGVADMDGVIYRNWAAEGRENFTSHSFSIDGTGVDIIISDPAFYYDHSEFLDEYGNTRLQKIDWNTHLGLTQDETGFDSSDPSKWYTNSGTHGTVMGSLAFGNIMGVAPGATPYYIKATFDYNNANHSEGQGTSWINAMNLARLFHESKSIDPTTGYKRPTVHVQSIAFGMSLRAYAHLNSLDYFTTPSHVVTMSFAGTTITASGTNFGDYIRTPQYNMGALNTPGIVNQRVDWIDAVCEEQTDAGVIFCRAGGNNTQVHFASGSEDDPDFDPNNDGWYDPLYWDSYFSFDVDLDDTARGVFYPAYHKFYYCRGSSPTSNATFHCGALDATAYYPTTERNNPDFPRRLFPTTYSAKGPRVDVYCPIGVSAARPNSQGEEAARWVSSVAYDPPYYGPLPTNQKTFSRLSGTSFASPTVGGVVALYLQVNPGANATEIRKWLRKNAAKMDPNVNSSTTKYRDNIQVVGAPLGADDNGIVATMGGPTQSIVVNPYTAPIPLTTQGNLKFSGSIKFTL